MRYVLFALALAGFVVAIWQRVPGIMPAGVVCISLAVWPHSIRSNIVQRVPDSRPAATRPVDRATAQGRKSA